MSTLQSFRWLTRRHLHVSAKIAADSVKLVESSSDSSNRPTEICDPEVPLPKKKRPKKRKITGPSLLVESKVKNFLDHVESIKDTFGLEDLERYKPDRQPLPTSPEFEEQYNALRDTLCHAFNKQQLQAFLRLYGLCLPTGYTKAAHVTRIMEKAWSWPSLEGIKKEKDDWTVSSQRSSYLLPPSCSRQIIQAFQISLWMPDSPFYSLAKVCHCLIRRGHFSWTMYRWHRSPQYIQKLQRSCGSTV